MEAEKAEYPVTFNFEGFNEKPNAGELRTDNDQNHSVPIVINAGKIKLKKDRQGNIIEVKGKLKRN